MKSIAGDPNPKPKPNTNPNTDPNTDPNTNPNLKASSMVVSLSLDDGSSTVSLNSELSLDGGGVLLVTMSSPLSGS